ncbi:MAG: hypothetical protein E4H09_01895 [Spirochaetales bacterium]|nr:MAG: hypothetical protein E4H09_01895 [Spirochaetales bacterium]
MRVVFTVAILCIASLAMAQPASYVITSTVRLPAESYVGDPVEFRYTLRTDAAVREPVDVPMPPWGTIGYVRVIPRDGEFEVRIAVTPFEPGTLTLPELTLGDIRLEGLSVTVASVLEDEPNGLRSVIGPQRLPGTQALLLGVAFGVAFAIACGLFILGPGRRHLHTFLMRYRQKVPYKRLLRDLQRVEDRLKIDTAREFYIAIVAAIQQFMGLRLGRECRAATSTELTALLPDLARAHQAPPDGAGELKEIFDSADAAKFASSAIRRSLRVTHLATVRRVAAVLEASRKPLRRRAPSTAKEAPDVGV